MSTFEDRVALMRSAGVKGPKQLHIKTKNSIPDHAIAYNIGYSNSKGFKRIQNCRIHGGHAIVVSGGPSYKEHLDEIRHLASLRGNFLVCVKTSHDFLLANGILPWACILLDPRPHVLDYVKDPHPKITYIMASQVSSRTVDRLVEAKAKVILYHAMVGGFMDDIVKEEGYIMGGSTAATRGLMALGALGFRKFTLFGYDSCYPDNEPRKGLRGQDIEYIEAEVNGRQFWTDAEMLAQAQDFESMKEMDIDLTLVGNGMIPHVWDNFSPRRIDFTEFIK